MSGYTYCAYQSPQHTLNYTSIVMFLYTVSHSDESHNTWNLQHVPKFFNGQ